MLTNSGADFPVVEHIHICCSYCIHVHTYIVVLNNCSFFTVENESSWRSRSRRQETTPTAANNVTY